MARETDSRDSDTHDPATPERRPRARPAAQGLPQSPWQQPHQPDAPAPLTPEQQEAILTAALTLLEETGIDMGSPDLCRALRAAGARVSGTTVRMGADFVTEMLARAPARFTITPRNPDRALQFGTGLTSFGLVSSATHVWDIERGKRLGDWAAFRDMIRLAQQMNSLHFIGGYPVEPADIPPAERHLRCMAEVLRLSDKVCHAYALTPAQAEEAMELVRLAAGLSPAEFAAAPRMFANINPVTPLRQDGQVLEAALRFARQGQPVIVTSFVVAGVNAPARVGGAVVLALAEALSAIALLQFLAPGTPVMLGALMPMADGASGAPVYAGPETALALRMMGQMARRLGLPFRASGGCTAAIPDGQGMWETARALSGAEQAGAAMIYHAAGWLEGGLTASPDKLLMDCEILQQMARASAPDLAAITPEDLDPASIARGCAQGFARQGDAAPLRGFLSDLRSYEAWELDGALWTSERAHRLAARLLEGAEDPALDHAAAEALDAFVAARLAG